MIELVSKKRKSNVKSLREVLLLGKLVSIKSNKTKREAKIIIQVRKT